MSDASSFDRDGFLLRQGKARRKYCRIYKGFNAAWVKIIRSKPTAVHFLVSLCYLYSQRDLIRNHGYKFRIGRLTAAILNSITEI